VASASNSLAFSPPDKFATGVSARAASRPNLASCERTTVSVSYGGASANGVSSFHNASSTSLRDVERQQIITALEKTGWHRGKTAELLGISPSTLYRRLREYDLEAR
jgi:transcriptional regulator of acetoin/glycerol metabolism